MTVWTDLLGNVLLTKDGPKPTDQVLSGKKVVGLYFSAHWCPPCRGFTPVLSTMYEQVVEAYPDLEIVFVSADQDQSAFDGYFGEMTFKALPFENRAAEGALSEKFGVQGIPTLIFLNGSGELITSEGRSVIQNANGDADAVWNALQFELKIENHLEKVRERHQIQALATIMGRFIDDGETIYRAQPPRIAKVRAIEATSRILRPTKAYLLHKREKVVTTPSRRPITTSTATFPRTRAARAQQTAPRSQASSLTGKRKRSTSTRAMAPAPPLKRKKLTIPKSPQFHAMRKRQPKSPQLSRTSRELREIEALRNKVKEQKQRNQRYHDATTHSSMVLRSGSMTTDKAAFSKTMQSCGSVGIPAIRRAKLTVPKGFDFEIDKRAAEKQKRLREKQAAEEAKAQQKEQLKLKQQRWKRQQFQKKTQTQPSKRRPLSEVNK